MKIIGDYVETIDNELKDAKNYAEKYIYQRSLGNSQEANYFQAMANDELKHAVYNHEMAIKEIKRISEVFQPTQAMQDAWDKSHIRYVEMTAWIKKMLDM